MITIRAPKNFSFSECIWFLDRGFDEVLYRVEDGHITRPLYFKGEILLIDISGDNTQLTIDVLNKEVGKEAYEYIRNYVTEWFDLNLDIEPYYSLARQDIILAPLIKRYEGLRLMAITDMFEALSWSIIGQQINLTFAYKLKRALTEKFGRSIEYNGKTFHLFPRPKDLLGVTKEELLALQFSKQKANYIISLAEVLDNDGLVKGHLSELPLSEAVEQLTKLKGIGPWTANYVAMKCLKHTDAFPIQDVGLHNALKVILKRGAKPGIEEIQAMSENWKGWRAYATLYLWRSLSKKTE